MESFMWWVLNFVGWGACSWWGCRAARSDHRFRGGPLERCSAVPRNDGTLRKLSDPWGQDLGGRVTVLQVRARGLEGMPVPYGILTSVPGFAGWPVAGLLSSGGGAYTGGPCPCASACSAEPSTRHMSGTWSPRSTCA